MNPKQRAKALRYSLLAIFTVVIVCLIGYITPTKWHYPPQSDCTYPIYVSSVNHFHAELILPVTTAAYNWRSHLTLTLDPISIFDALFLPSPTAIHVWGHTEEPSQWPKDFEIKQVQLNRAQYLKLVQFINASFQHTAQGSAQYIRPGLYPDSGFYEAVGSYSIARTCNTWTADALKQADVNTPVWSATAPAIMQHLHSNCGIAKPIGKS
jgi:hypothetical protein